MASVPDRDQCFEAFVRAGFRCVAQHSGECSGRIEFSHNHHSGIGGKDVPSIGNGTPMCSWHHTAGGGALHTIGRQSFETRYAVDLEALAQWLARDFDGDFIQLAEPLPFGIVRTT
jgi:hypothetical protein